MPAKDIILGIDPGSNLLGYAFLQVFSTQKPRLISMGVVDIRSETQQAQKLNIIFKELQKLIDLYEPSRAAVEAPFYGKNVQAMLKLGRAQGAAMLALANKNLEVAEYSPRSIKKAVTGKGNATKQQLAKMLPHIIDGSIQSDHLDAYDALGVAFCHYIQMKNQVSGKKHYNDWSAFLKANPNRKNIL